MRRAFFRAGMAGEPRGIRRLATGDTRHSASPTAWPKGSFWWFPAGLLSGRDALKLDMRASIWAWLKTMSGEVAKDGVTMNVLAPGTILSSAAAPGRRRNIGFEEALAERMGGAVAQVLAGWVGTPGEYGPMGAFLASDKAGYIAGSRIRVDGGRIRGMV